MTPLFSPLSKDVIDYSCHSLIPRWLQEIMAQSKDNRYKMETEMPNFSVFSSFGGPNSQCFSAKAV
jgi:hypothetical protein